MVSLKLLEELGYSNAFFKLPEGEPGENSFSYYTFAYKWDLKQMSSWNIVGVRHSKEKSLFIELALFSIEEEALTWKPFEPWSDADGILGLGQTEVLALIDFLVSLLGQDAREISMHTYFASLQAGDFERMHIKKSYSAMSEKGFYYYLFHEFESDQDQENICLVQIPQWLSKKESHIRCSLAFTTFDRQCLYGPEFNLLDINKPYAIPFNQQSLSEFVHLLQSFLP